MDWREASRRTSLPSQHTHGTGRKSSRGPANFVRETNNFGRERAQPTMAFRGIFLNGNLNVPFHDPHDQTKSIFVGGKMLATITVMLCHPFIIIEWERFKECRRRRRRRRRLHRCRCRRCRHRRCRCRRRRCRLSSVPIEFPHK